MRHPVDVAAMFAALWLLASMVLDAATPKELTVYMIAAATAPAAIITAALYYLQVPRVDFAVVFSTLWLVSGVVIELISPKTLPTFMIGIAMAPAFLVGAVLHWQGYRRRGGELGAPTVRRP